VNRSYSFAEARKLGRKIRDRPISWTIFVFLGERLAEINDDLEDYERLKANTKFVRPYQGKYMRIARPMWFLGFVEREDVAILLREDPLSEKPLDPVI
jgi:hypothetical protein